MLRESAAASAFLGNPQTKMFNAWLIAALEAGLVFSFSGWPQPVCARSALGAIRPATRSEPRSIADVARNVGTTWEQNHPNTGQNGATGPTSKQDESAT